MQTRQKAGPWERRLLARLQTLTAAQQDAIFQAVDLIATENSRIPRRPTREAKVIPIRSK